MKMIYKIFGEPFTLMKNNSHTKAQLEHTADLTDFRPQKLH